jgi:glucose/arabinose dehydrogenase
MRTQPLIRRSLGVAVLALVVDACGGSARLPVSAGTGPNPEIPEPRTSVIPTVHVVSAKGWSADASPTPSPGLTVTPFARGLSHPRWLYVLPNGDVLVAETNAPNRPDDNKGIKGWFFKKFQAKAGGAVPSANRITLLRDADGDGVAETRSVLLSGLTSPFGMALVGNTLYVANADALVRFPYSRGDMRISARATTVSALPGGPINHHWTKNVVASPDGRQLYVSVGSNSNAGENGIDEEVERAAVWEVDPLTGKHRIFAAGLRNPVGMAWVPETRVLWVSVNERDELGSDLVPDFMTGLRDGAFYGWPWVYYGTHIDRRPKRRSYDSLTAVTTPDYALGPHTASLGLAWSPESSAALPRELRHGMFVGQHGSWNRKPRSGYKVIFVPFTGGLPSGAPVDVLSGFVRDDGDAMGRPVGVAIDGRGALLVADDVGNTVWRVGTRR